MKKVLAGLLSALMILTLVNLTAFANPEGFKEEFDYSTNEWITNEEMAILNKMGVSSWASISDMGSRNTEVTSRWFAAWYVCNMLQLKPEKPVEFETLFKDLTSEHSYYAQIKAVVEGGYMNGYPDGYFRPNEALSTMEFAEILLNVLGYKPYIYAMGKQKALDMTNLLDGVPITDALIQPQTLRMIYNAFNSPVIKTSGNITMENGQAMMEVEVNESYLGFEHLRGVKHEVAVLDGMEGTTLNKATDGIRKGFIHLAGEEFRYSGDAADLLGYRVNYLYTETENGEKTILYLFKSSKNDEKELNFDEIDGFADGVYTYIDGNKIKTIELTPDTKIIYNGIANPGYSEEEMCPRFGSVTFIDNDGKRGYEVVKIDSVDFYLSSMVNASDLKIYDTQNKPGRILDLKEADYSQIMSGDSEIIFERIKKSNLIAVKRSSANSDYDKVLIETFKVSKKAVKITAIKDNVASSSIGDLAIWEGIADSVEIGKYYNIYMYNDIVVMIVEDADNGPEHAYLISVGLDGNPFSKSTRFAIVDSDGNYFEVEGAEKIFIDGEPYEGYSIQTALFKSAKIGNGHSVDYPYSQPVRIKFNSKGQLNWIDTFVETAEDDENSLKHDEKSVPVNTTYNGLRYSHYSGSLYNSTPEKNGYFTTHIVSIGSGTKILFVPDDRFEEDAYFAKEFDSGSYYLVDPIGMDDILRVADVVYVYYKPTAQEIGTYTRQTLISDLRTELDADGETVYTVEGYYQSKLKTYTCDEELFKNMSVGDIYRFEADKKGHIATSVKVFSSKEGIPSRDNRQQLNTSNPNLGLAGSTGTIFGTLVHAEEGFARVCQALVTDEEPFDAEFKVDNFMLDSATVYRYTTIQGRPVIEKASISEAIPYSLDPKNPSTVIVNVLSGTNQIIIYEP